MKSTPKLSSDERRADILKAVRRVFVEKGFHETTTRELARAAGVSEALLYKHFPSKKAIYSAIQNSCFNEERAKAIERMEALEPSTSNLVFLVHYMFSQLFGERLSDDNVRSFIRLVLRSLMDEGEFARSAITEGPLRWVRKVDECIKAAIAAGDAVNGSAMTNLAGWFAHHVATMIMINLLHAKQIVEYKVSRKKLQEQAVLFTLRGMGLKEKAIKRYYNPRDMKPFLI